MALNKSKVAEGRQNPQSNTPTLCTLLLKYLRLLRFIYLFSLNYKRKLNLLQNGTETE